MSSQGLFNSQVVNQVSLNLIGGYTAGVNGVEVGGVFNINQKDARHFQVAGAFNLVGRHVRGVQIAGVSNIAVQQVSGVQVAGVNNRGGDARGMQVSGLFNVAENTKGVQLAGLMNKSTSETGVQVAGILNIAGKVKGVQLAPLLNIADSSDYSIALINLIKNGSKSVMVGVDESSMAHVAFRSGGRVLYGLIGAGYYLKDLPMTYALETGLGAQLLSIGLFRLDAELVNRVSTDFKRHSESRLSFRLLPQLSLGQHLAIVAGPTINYTYPDKGSDLSNNIAGWKWYHDQATGKTLHVGVYGGLLYRW